jgi:hypothetical protein
MSKTFDDNLVVEFKEPPFSPTTLQKGKHRGQRPSRIHPRLPTRIDMDGSLQLHVPPKSNGTQKINAMVEKSNWIRDHGFAIWSGETK